MKEAHQDICRRHGLQLYKVVKLFVKGSLEGLTREDITTARYTLGKVYGSFGTDYRIVSVTKID